MSEEKKRPRNNASRSNNPRNRRRKKKQIPPALIVGLVVVFVVIVCIISSIIEKHTPSKKVMSQEDINARYGIAAEGDVAIVLNGKIIADEKALYEEDKVYLRYEFVKTNINDKFYWDNFENILSVTTPTDIIRSHVGTTEYTVTNSTKTVDYQVVKTKGNTVYIAADFIKEYTAFECAYYQTPNRVVIKTSYGEENVGTINKNIKIREKADIKADIVYSATAKTKVKILGTSKGFSEVATADGWFGYVKSDEISGKKTESTVSTYVAPEYTRISLDKTISLGWDQISVKGGGNLINNVTNAKGLNVVSPTWYRFEGNEGGLSSFADATYVEQAHLIGLQVWAMVDDQSENSNDTEIFTHTSRRDAAVNTLVAEAIQYGIDGINIDVEYLKEEASQAYIQFMRELSVKCRINGIILSVDIKVPETRNNFCDVYGISKLGEVCDYVIMMGYDEHMSVDTGAGSTASLNWVSNGIKYMTEQMDSSKIVCGIPFYTRSFTVDGQDNVIETGVLPMGKDLELLASKGVEATWVEEYGQKYGEYQEGDNIVRIWVEDAASIEAKLQLIEQYNIAGIAAWRLGLEDVNIWNTIIKYTN